MLRVLAASTALALGLASASIAPVRAQGAPAAAALTPAAAAAFMGDWTLAMESPMGPSAMALSVKTEGKKVVGQISSEMQPSTPITDVSKVADSLLLSYTFTYEGNPVPVIVTLTPAAEGKLTANLDFGGGAFIMAGTASKAAVK